MSFIQWSYYFLGDTGPWVATWLQGAAFTAGLFGTACLIDYFIELVEGE